MNKLLKDAVIWIALNATIIAANKLEFIGAVSGSTLMIVAILSLGLILTWEYWERLNFFPNLKRQIIPSFAIGVILGIVISYNGISVEKQNQLSPIPTQVSLQFFASGTPPLMLSQKNLYRWYALNGDLRNGNTLARIVTVTWLFDKPTYYKQIEIRSLQNIPLPQYEVKDSNDRYAIIAFMGTVPDGAIEFELRQ